jgi:hypothetical protein
MEPASRGTVEEVVRGGGWASELPRSDGSLTSTGEECEVADPRVDDSPVRTRLLLAAILWLLVVAAWFSGTAVEYLAGSAAFLCAVFALVSVSRMGLGRRALSLRREVTVASRAFVWPVDFGDRTQVAVFLAQLGGVAALVLTVPLTAS